MAASRSSISFAEGRLLRGGARMEEIRSSIGLPFESLDKSSCRASSQSCSEGTSTKSLQKGFAASP